MSDLQRLIMRDIEDDISIGSTDVAVDVQSRGFLKRKRIIRLSGAVGSETDRRKIARIAEHHAGDSWVVVNELTLKEHSSV